jgi:hypothetical protein
MRLPRNLRRHFTFVSAVLYGSFLGDETALAQTSNVLPRGPIATINASGATYFPSSGSVDGWLGRGFTSDLLRFHENCAVGKHGFRGNTSGRLRTKYNSDFTQLIDDVSGRLSAGVSLFGIIGGDVEVSYTARSARTEYSTALTNDFEAAFGSLVLDNMTVSDFAKSLTSRADGSWFDHCGDAVVTAVHLGSRLSTGLVFHLNTKEELERFITTVRVKFFGQTIAKKRFKEETSSFDQNSRLEIIAFQSGGHPEELVKLWNGKKSLCSFGDADPCFALWDALLEYSGSTTGYRSQFRHPYDPVEMAAIGYDVVNYADTDLDEIAMVSPSQSTMTVFALRNLLDLRGRVYALLARVQILLDRFASNSGRVIELSKLQSDFYKELIVLDDMYRNCQLPNSTNLCFASVSAERARITEFERMSLSF